MLWALTNERDCTCLCIGSMRRRARLSRYGGAVAGIPLPPGWPAGAGASRVCRHAGAAGGVPAPGGAVEPDAADDGAGAAGHAAVAARCVHELDTLHYLKAVQAAGTDEAKAVMAKMKQTPVNDFFAKNGRIREDGRHVHDFYLLQVKKPEESKYPWDYYKTIATISPEDAAKPLEASECPLVKK